MKVAFNTMFKNESKLLDVVLPIWSKYKVDLFIFFNDHSTDDSCEIIKKHLPENRFIIINSKLQEFNESVQRQLMIDESIKNNVDYIFSLDVDELLSSSIVNNFTEFLKIYKTKNLLLFWYNCVNGTLDYYRMDPQYFNNYRSFVLPVKSIGRLNPSDWKYHTPRTPIVNLPTEFSRDYGIIHLQSVNTKFYAVKQLWYKHHEFVKYGHSVEFINGRYDPVVNNLNFNPVKTDKKIIEGISIDLSVFENMEKDKGYLKFIKEHYNDKLITFGKEFL